jgi:hypothetical protein
MRALWLPYWFFPSVAAYGMIRCWRLYGGVPQILNDYFTDLLCMPVVLAICIAGVRLIKRDPMIRAGIGMVAIVTLQFSILFELVLPVYNPDYRGDWLDILMYVTGALFFILDDRLRSRRLGTITPGHK